MKVLTSIPLVYLALLEPAPLLQEEIPQAKAGKRHELLKEFEGTWDTIGKIWFDPEKPAIESKGPQTSTITCNGLWLIYTTKGDVGGKPYEGHGMFGYNEDKGKYVDCYVDNLSTGMDTYEGDWDEKTRTLSMVWEGVDADGKPLRARNVVEIKDKDTQMYTSYQGPVGKETVTGQWEYKRRK